jgi:hypothetical protein
VLKLHAESNRYEWHVVENVDDIEHDLSKVLWLESDDNHEIPSCDGCCADILHKKIVYTRQACPVPLIFMLRPNKEYVTACFQCLPHAVKEGTHL